MSLVECNICEAQFVLVKNLESEYSLEPKIYKIYWEENNGIEESFLINDRNAKDYAFMYVAETKFLRERT